MDGAMEFNSSDRSAQNYKIQFADGVHGTVATGFSGTVYYDILGEY
jgi:hypothetical protein